MGLPDHPVLLVQQSVLMEDSSLLEWIPILYLFLSACCTCSILYNLDAYLYFRYVDALNDKKRRILGQVQNIRCEGEKKNKAVDLTSKEKVQRRGKRSEKTHPPKDKTSGTKWVKLPPVLSATTMVQQEDSKTGFSTAKVPTCPDMSIDISALVRSKSLLHLMELPLGPPEGSLPTLAPQPLLNSVLIRRKPS